MKKTLTKYYSREKNMFYLGLWNEADRKGIKLLGGDLEHNLFVVRPKGQKGEVWHEPIEVEELKTFVIETLNGKNGLQIINKLKKIHEKAWAHMKPYVTNEKKISSFEELEAYYRQQVLFWITMNSFIWEAHQKDEINKTFRDLFISWREKTEKYTKKFSEVISDYVKETYPELDGLEWFITFNELKDIVKGKNSTQKIKEMKNRLNGCFMLNNIIYPLSELDNTLKKSNLNLKKELVKNITVITGSIGYKGIIQGEVALIDGIKDLHKVKNGNILVTQMTNPDYLPVMQKAAAFITDEGGMLCHAAIVSRELKIPCIIGTKIATQVLKDGDLVEVDANNGKIKILKKKITNHNSPKNCL